jgi:ribosomal protein S4E
VNPAQDDAVEVDGHTLRWRRVTTNADALDFHPIFGGQTDNAVAYAVAVVDSPREVRNATLYLGSDDGARVWLNGQQVWSVNHIRGVNPDEDVIPHLTLRQGRNLLVVKVAQGVGGWGLAARVEIPKNGK